MKAYGKGVLYLLLILVTTISDHAHAQFVIPETPTPTQFTEKNVRQIIAVLRDADLQAPDKKSLRQALIRKAFNSLFDFNEMAKSSLGSWYRKLKREASYQELEASYLKAFVDNLAANYIENLEANKDDIKIAFVREWREGEFADVYAKVRVKIKGADQDISVTYRLRWLGNPGWRVFDLKIENMSTVLFFRNVFGKFLDEHKGSLEDLIKALREGL